MKKTTTLTSILLSCIVMVVVSLFSSGCRTEPKPKFTNKKVIVTHLGEVARNIKYIGETNKYKIYYLNTTKEKTNIVIADKLDSNLSDITALSEGYYDQPSHTITWKIADVEPFKGGFVEFEAIIEAADKILNKAIITLNETTKIETNQVETTVTKKPKVGWIPLEQDSKPGQTPRSNMKEETTTGTMVNFSMPGIFIYEVNVEGTFYHRLALPGKGTLTNIGKPELPIVGQLIEVPYDVNFKIEIVKSQFITIKNYNVYPAQEEAPGADKYKEKFVIDPKAYSLNVLYPRELAAFNAQDIGIIRGHRVVFLKANPVQYNPVTRELKIFSQIEARLNFDRPAQIGRVNRRIESKAFEDLLEATVLNYKPPKRFDAPTNINADVDSDPDTKKDGCDYLIITHSDFYDQNNAGNPNDPTSPNNPNNPIVKLGNWKLKKGLKVKIVEMVDIPNGTTADDIRDFIKDDVYDTWYPVPTYILLVGDAGDNAGNEIVPTNYQTGHNSHAGTDTGTDLYYVTVDGTDYFPDIFIGRLSVDSINQADDVITKIIEYERNPPATPANAAFYTDVTLIALFEDIFVGLGDTSPEDGIEDRPWIENVEDIRGFLDANYNLQLVYATSSGFPPAGPGAATPQRYQNGNLLPAALQVPPFGWDGDDGDITAGINAGRFLITYRDHGSWDGWSGFIGFDNVDVTALANGNLLPVIFSIACQTGWFDNETDDNALGTNPTDESFCEEFIRNSNGGAVAIIGSTRNSWTGHNDFFMFGLHKAIWQDYVPNPPLIAADYPNIPDIVETEPLLRLGQIHTYGKIYMANAYSHTANNRRLLQFEMYHLFGDPEMPIWIEAPETLNVDHPSDIGSTGTQDFIVKVTDNTTGDPVHLAVVTLSRDNDILRTSFTNPDGIARFTITGPTAGNIDITVTALSCRPYENTISVSVNGADINRLDPDNGVANLTQFKIGGQNFSGIENVKIYFNGQDVTTTAATAGSFGQTGGTDVDITVPAGQPLGLVNIVAEGQTRYAVDVFQVRSANPIDLYTYSQWDSTTWNLNTGGGGNPTWDNPEIQLYDSSNNSVASNNLVAGNSYTIKAKIHNDTGFNAQGVQVTFTCANFGAGQVVWTHIGNDTLDVPNTGVREAEVSWVPQTGHKCILVEIYHVEDINLDNNKGQENCDVSGTASPAEIPFLIWNPTEKSAMVHLELRQILKPGQDGPEWMWNARLRQPDPQLIMPGQKEGIKALVSIEPPDHIKPGQEAEFALTAFIGRKVVGGVNFTVIKGKEREKE